MRRSPFAIEAEKVAEHPLCLIAVQLIEQTPRDKNCARSLSGSSSVHHVAFHEEDARFWDAARNGHFANDICQLAFLEIGRIHRPQAHVALNGSEGRRSKDPPNGGGHACSEASPCCE